MSERVRFPKQTGYGQIFDDSIRRCPDREAIVVGSWRSTSRELGQHICRAAHFLEARGLKRGDRAAIISRNCPEYLILEFAMYKLGIVPVKFNWRLTADEMIYLMDFNQVRCAFLRVENPVWGQQLLDHYAGKLPIFVLEGAEDERNYCNKYGFAKEMVLPFLHKPIQFAPKGKIALILMQRY